MTESKGIVAPVIGGIAVGISFIVVFASIFSSISVFNNFERSVTVTKDGITFSLMGLKSRYPVGEAIYFTVTAKGYGKLCSPLIARIVNVDSGDEVEHFSKSFPNCNSAERDIDETWTLDDILKDMTGSPHLPVLIHSLNGSGHYKLVIEYGEATLNEVFVQD